MATDGKWEGAEIREIEGKPLPWVAARVMRVLLSTYRSREDVDPMGLAVQLRALGAEGCDALVATDVTPAGVWR